MNSLARIAVFLSIVFTSCYVCVGDTADPAAAFKCWTGANAKDHDVHPVKVKYWQSGHFTQEYEICIEFTAPKKIISNLLANSQLHESTEGRYIPTYCPEWFNPKETHIPFVEPNFAERHNYILYLDKEKNHVFLYRRQL